MEEHEKAYDEHARNIKRIVEEGVEENQRNLAYNISQGSIELFAIYMHTLHLWEGSGDQLDHRVFKSKNLIEMKIPSDFPSRGKILDLMRSIELERIALCYGNRKPRARVENLIVHFNELRRLINLNLHESKTK